MLEKALTGGKRYWAWLAFLSVFIAIALIIYIFRQIPEGLGYTGMSRDVTWGLYIAQFTFLVGVAASAVMVVLPYYLHDYKAFGKITILGEFLAIAAVIMCLLFIMADLGQPQRGLNIILNASPKSILFWDMVSLNGYLLLNIVISRVTLGCERKGIKPPRWIKPIIIISIPWAVSIHTVTAFIYCGLASRSIWFTAILAPRFLASAFASGPAFLILLCFIVRKFTKFDPGREAIQKLAVIAAYAMAVNVFFVLLEVFTATYSGIPHHIHQFEYLFFGLEGKSVLAPWMWISEILAVIALVLMITPRYRKKENLLILGCIAIFSSLWIDKGLGMVVTGFVPNPMGEVVEYTPTFPEIMVTIGIYAIGYLILTVLFKVALEVRHQVPHPERISGQVQTET
jgi:molybdopterin-containing oxidoreductase family membrane subunit